MAKQRLPGQLVYYKVFPNKQFRIKPNITNSIIKY